MVSNVLLNKMLNFGGDPDHRLDTGIVFKFRHYWEIRKVIINGDNSPTHTDSLVSCYVIFDGHFVLAVFMFYCFNTFVSLSVLGQL